MQVIAYRDALIELPHFAQIELVSQFGLSNEDNLQQFAVIRFQIGEHTELFKHRELHILGLVDNHHGIAPGCEFVE